MTIRVAVAGAAGRMGQAVVAAVEGADDMQLTGRADPALGTAVEEVLAGADVLVDFTRPDTALDHARAAVPDGASILPSWCSSTISALAMCLEASAAKRIISTALIAKFGAAKTMAPSAHSRRPSTAKRMAVSPAQSARSVMRFGTSVRTGIARNRRRRSA